MPVVVVMSTPTTVETCLIEFITLADRGQDWTSRTLPIAGLASRLYFHFVTRFSGDEWKGIVCVCVCVCRNITNHKTHLNSISPVWFSSAVHVNVIELFLSFFEWVIADCCPKETNC